jgi:YesN/AraC family two-component response regulator
MSSSNRKRSIHLNYKQGSGYSISDAIMKLRIEKTKQALTVPSSRVNDVSQQVGFLDTGTFIRSFKKLEGMTPGAYKSQFQEVDQFGSVYKSK